MKTTTYIAIIMAVMLSACASQTPYKQANGSKYGYKETSLGKDRQRITFTQRSADTSQAMDYSLLRAAEVTLLEGYDWFVVVDRQTLVDRERAPSTQIGASRSQVVTRDCGLLGCRTSTRPATSSSFDVSASNQQSEVQVILEIRMGKGVRPENNDSYDAMETRETLQGQMAKS